MELYSKLYTFEIKIRVKHLTLTPIASREGTFPIRERNYPQWNFIANFTLLKLKYEIA